MFTQIFDCLNLRKGSVVHVPNRKKKRLGPQNINLKQRLFIRITMKDGRGFYGEINQMPQLKMRKI